MEDAKEARRKELWAKRRPTPQEEIELQSLLISYRDELKRLRHLTAEEAGDLQWIYDNPPKARIFALKEDHDWDQKMEEYSVYKRDQSGKCILGANGTRLSEYEASRIEILVGSMRIGSRGDVIPFDTDARKLVLPTVNLKFTQVGIDGRCTFLFGLTEQARASRLRVIEQLVSMGAELSECEKIDRSYLKGIVKKTLPL